ncbi:hypothetical protein ACGFYY_15445 [Streptomyces sp. NPDC048331]|uniref:hypothetical protein n=1 Tax=Streptomyces sp. NPDC048331 TaxID=3365534 RepID=UPI00371F8069
MTACTGIPSVARAIGAGAAHPRMDPVRCRWLTAFPMMLFALPAAAASAVAGPLVFQVRAIRILRRAVRAYLGHNPDPRRTAFDMYPRTPAHATTRVNWKWHLTNGPDRAHPEYDGPDRNLRPAGYLATLLIEQECDLPHCEMGVHLDSGEECRLCRYQQRRDAAVGHDQAAIDAVHDEAVAANEAYDRIRAARVARAAEAEEMARLRERLTEDHPETAADAVRSLGIPAPRDGGADYAGAGRRGRRTVEEETARAALVREGLRGTALDEAVRSHMAAWKARRRQSAQAPFQALGGP